MKPIQIKQRKNTYELAYENMILKPLKYANEILDYYFESFNIRLGDNCFYKFDYFVVYPDRFEVHEVKGGTKDKKTLNIVPYCQDDALVKIKNAAYLYPYWKWVIKFMYKKVWYTREIN